MKISRKDKEILDREPTTDGWARRGKDLGPAKQMERVEVKNGADNTRVASTDPTKVVSEARLKEAYGTSDMNFLKGLLAQLSGAALTNRKNDEGKLKFILSVVIGQKPKDQLECMLLTQIAEFQMIVMTFLRQLALTQTIMEQDSTERALNKFSRTFVMLVEALNNYLGSGAENNVTVHSMSLHDDAQAIVGHVTHSSSESAPDKGTTAPEALSDAKAAPMPILDSIEPKIARFRSKSLK